MIFPANAVRFGFSPLPLVLVAPNVTGYLHLKLPLSYLLCCVNKRQFLQVLLKKFLIVKCFLRGNGHLWHYGF